MGGNWDYRLLMMVVKSKEESRNIPELSLKHEAAMHIALACFGMGSVAVQAYVCPFLPAQAIYSITDEIQT